MKLCVALPGVLQIMLMVMMLLLVISLLGMMKAMMLILMDYDGDLVLASVPWPNRATIYSVYPAVVFVHGNLDVWVGASLTLPTTRSSVAVAE